MSTRNYGLGSRDMARAGEMALKTRSGLSFSSVATLSERWGEFCRWARGEGIKKMENVSRDTLLRYGRALADKSIPANLGSRCSLTGVQPLSGLFQFLSTHSAFIVWPLRRTSSWNLAKHNSSPPWLSTRAV